MNLKTHFKKRQLRYLNLVLLTVKKIEESSKKDKDYTPPKLTERTMYSNKKSRVGYLYYKPISKILTFKDEG